MGKLRAFVQLDFMTAKTGFQPQTVLIYLAITVAVLLFVRNAITVVWILASFALSFINMPFGIGESRNMDALYAMLNVSRKTVVKGRYIYAFTVLALAVVLCLLVGGVVLLLESVLDTNLYAGATFGIIATIAAINVFTISTQLPIFFRFGLGKSAGWTAIPNILIMLVPLFYFNMFLRPDFDGRIFALLENPAVVIAGLAAVVTLLTVVVYVSYRVSVKFYIHTKREF
ncbi:MAG: ABC-2 transporter permease [Defluviitaleaceae bacterium]|nr:ABC-2 transporter permease [Defluviitaleaceae bacterium]